MSTTFENVHYTLKLNKLVSNLRLLLISDLHMMEHGPGNSHLLKACRREQPDLILLSGDLITSLSQEHAGYREALAEVNGFAAKLAEIAPVYAVNGNHETNLRKLPGLYQTYMQGLKNAGIHVLNNKSMRTVIRGNTLILTGLELEKQSYHKFRRPSFSVNRIRKAVGDAANDGSGITGSTSVADRIGTASMGGPSHVPCRILLAHNPVFAPFYMEWGADLTVCGHFHGGVMRLFGKQPLLSPYGFILPDYGYGHFEKDGKHVIVSSGLGEHVIPFRIFNPMELVTIDLIPDVTSDN
jgi:hypothetical protein